MGIENFPASLQAAIQQGFLAREFQDGLRSKLGFGAVADVELFPNQIGETLTKTRKGLKSPVTTPMNPTSNTNFDNGSILKKPHKNILLWDYLAFSRGGKHYNTYRVKSARYEMPPQVRATWMRQDNKESCNV